MATPRLKWGSVEGLEAEINRYFSACDLSGYPPNVPEICLALHITRETWVYYVSGRYLSHVPSYIRTDQPEDFDGPEPAPSADDLAAVDGFDWPEQLAISGTGGDPRVWEDDQRIRRAVGQVLKRASMAIEAAWHREAIDLGRKGKSPIMPLFALKASHGYREDAPQLTASTAPDVGDSFRLVIDGAIPLEIDGPSGADQPALPEPPK